MYSYIAQVLFDRLPEKEWSHISSYIEKAMEMGNHNQTEEARKALKEASLAAASHEEYNAASLIEYYLRF